MFAHSQPGLSTADHKRVNLFNRHALLHVPMPGIRMARLHRPASGLAEADTGSTRPLGADRIAAVPACRSGTDRVENAHPRGRRVRHLDHRAWMALVAEIDEAAARAVALLADRV